MASVDVVYTSALRLAIRTAEIVVDMCDSDAPPPILTRWRLNERHYGLLTGLNKANTLKEWDRAELSEWRLSFGGAPPPMTPDHEFYSRTPERVAGLRTAKADNRESEDAEGDEALAESDVPLTESIADTVVRVRPLWCDEILPKLLAGQTALVVGHANCMRALVSCIQSGIDDDSLSTDPFAHAINDRAWSFGKSESAHDLMSLMPPASLAINVPAIASLSTSAPPLSVLSDDLGETPRITSWWMDATLGFLTDDVGAHETDPQPHESCDHIVPQIIIG